MLMLTLPKAYTYLRARGITTAQNKHRHSSTNDTLANKLSCKKLKQKAMLTTKRPPPPPFYTTRWQRSITHNTISRTLRACAARAAIWTNRASTSGVMWVWLKRKILFDTIGHAKRLLILASCIPHTIP